MDARLGADPTMQFPLTYESRKRAVLSSRRGDTFRLNLSKQF